MPTVGSWGGGGSFERGTPVKPRHRDSHGINTCSRMEKTTHSVTRGSRLELDLCHHDLIPAFVGERISLSRKSGLLSLIGIVDLQGLID